MTSFQAFDLDTLPKEGAGSGGPYTEVLRRPGFSMGIFRLPVGAEDHQHPHHADEVYIVQSGRGVLRVEDEDHPVGPGSVVSVDRGAAHNFTDIHEDLTIMVLFAPPETPEA